MFYLGIDVSKAKLDCVLLLDVANDKRRSKSVANTAKGVAELLPWAKKQTKQDVLELHVVMEATGIYHEVAADKLVELGAVVSIVNPAQVKHFAQGLAVRTKTDASDAAVLARYGALLSPAPWQPPVPEVKLLNAMCAAWMLSKQTWRVSQIAARRPLRAMRPS